MSREGEADAVVREAKECVGVTELLTLKGISLAFDIIVCVCIEIKGDEDETSDVCSGSDHVSVL